MARNRITAARSGISLIEVMISAGIVAVGLLSVAAILPLAGFYASKGQIADDSAALGRSAFHEFVIRGMGNEANLVEWNTSTGVANPVTLSSGVSYVIDPRFVVANSIVPPSGTPQPNPRNFPYVLPLNPAMSGLEPRMVRISLRQFPGNNPGILGAGGDRVLGPTSPVADVPADADEVFMAQDDLSISLPADTIVPPQQVGIGRRQFEGRLSWFATLVPLPRRPAVADGWYHLSIVVVNRRVMTMSDGAERVVLVDQTSNPSGHGGGEVALESTIESDLRVREGEWLLLSRKFSGSGISNPYFDADFKWYRVVSADPETELIPATPNRYRRYISLIGGDWNFDTTGTYPTWAVLVTGVVAVYERTVRLEGPSLWNN